MNQRRWGGFGEAIPTAKPRPVEGGLKARSARGDIGSSWWSKRFLAVLESFALGTRLTRGRAYARKGQVISLDVEPGVVRAAVQGSRARPYQVTISFEPLHELIWAKAEIALSEQALPSARLLAGEVPPELEEIFADAGAALFPTQCQRPCSALQLPGSAGALQAPGCDLLSAGRGVRRRPVPHPALARPGPGGVAGSVA